MQGNSRYLFQYLYTYADSGYTFMYMVGFGVTNIEFC